MLVYGIDFIPNTKTLFEQTAGFNKSKNRPRKTFAVRLQESAGIPGKKQFQRAQCPERGCGIQTNLGAAQRFPAQRFPVQHASEQAHLCRRLSLESCAVLRAQDAFSNNCSRVNDIDFACVFVHSADDTCGISNSNASWWNITSDHGLRTNY